MRTAICCTRENSNSMEPSNRIIVFRIRELGFKFSRMFQLLSTLESKAASRMDRVENISVETNFHKNCRSIIIGILPPLMLNI